MRISFLASYEDSHSLNSYLEEKIGMSITDQIIQRLHTLGEDRLVKLLEYIDFLAYQQEKEKDQGLQIAKERSQLYEQGKTQPISKEEFWQNLQNKLE